MRSDSIEMEFWQVWFGANFTVVNVVGLLTKLADKIIFRECA